MKTSPHLWVFLLALLGSHVHSAIVATTPATHYRSLEDSPWRVAVKAGDELVFVNHTWEGADAITGIGSIPQGYGVYDDFEESVTSTPWLQWGANHQEIISHHSVDGDDGILNSQGNGKSLHGLTQGVTFAPSVTLEFIPMSIGEYPKWFGFALIRASTTLPLSLKILGVNNSFNTVNLNNLRTDENSSTTFLNLTSDDVFIGFVCDTQIKSISLEGEFLLDHFQYGYGPGPIPEPGTCSLGLLGVALASRRRRSKLA